MLSQFDSFCTRKRYTQRYTQRYTHDLPALRTGIEGSRLQPAALTSSSSRDGTRTGAGLLARAAATSTRPKVQDTVTPNKQRHTAGTLPKVHLALAEFLDEPSNDRVGYVAAI